MSDNSYDIPFSENVKYFSENFRTYLRKVLFAKRKRDFGPVLFLKFTEDT